MLPYQNIIKVAQVNSLEDANTYLATDRWILLDLKIIDRKDQPVYTVYILGWVGPYDREFPETDTSEFPLGK